MSDDSRSTEDKVLQAAGIVAAAKGGIKIVAAMKMAGFSSIETKAMRTYQQVRRKAQQMVVVDTSVESVIPRVISSNKRSGGTSVVSSLTSEIATTSNGDGNDDTGSVANDDERLPTPRRLLGEEENDTEAPPSKKSRRSSRDVHAMQAEKAKRKKVEALAMKVATRRVNYNNSLAKNNPNKKSINFIVDEINTIYGSNISPKTVGRYVRKGMIGMSPMKKGPASDIPRAIYTSLKMAFATFLQLEQAESKTQSTMKQMSLRVNQCVNEAGHNKQHDDLAKKLKRDTADLFDCSKANVMEQRRLQWTTYDNLKVWFDTWKETVIDLGFGRERTLEDGNAGEGEVVFYPGQKERIVNIDETDGSLDDTTGQRGGRPPMVFTVPDMAGGGTAVNKSGYSSTIICGSNAAGEPVPPHFQLKSLAKTDEGQRMTVNWFRNCADVLVKFGHEEKKPMPCTFGMNERAGMNGVDLEKYIRNSILPLYPDAADEDLRRVLLKLDSGPGRMNIEMLANLRLQGFYVVPGVPNTTSVTQETDQNYGPFKSGYRTNIRKLSHARHSFRKKLVISDIALLVFGGDDPVTGITLANSFEQAFNEKANKSAWRKCGAVPLTRSALNIPGVRRELSRQGEANVEDAQQVRLKRIEEANRCHCDFLTGRGYYGNALQKDAPRVEKTAAALTVRHSKARIEAIRKAKGAGQLFHATGGTHLNSNEFFKAKALETRLEQARVLEEQKNKRTEALIVEEKARDLLSSKGDLSLQNKSCYKVKDIKILLKWKGLKIQKGQAKKEYIIALYLTKPPPPPTVPWSDAEEAILQDLKEVDVPLEQTALGIAAKQMARGVANSIQHLDEQSRHNLLQSLASFETANPTAGP